MTSMGALHSQPYHTFLSLFLHHLRLYSVMLSYHPLTIKDWFSGDLITRQSIFFLQPDPTFDSITSWGLAPHHFYYLVALFVTLHPYKPTNLQLQYTTLPKIHNTIYTQWGLYRYCSYILS